jgi:hypothetical protein
VCCAAALAGCGIRVPAESERAAELLAVPVESTKPLPIVEFNEKSAAAMAAGQTWPRDPLAVTSQLTGAAGRTAVWAIRGLGEHPTRYDITAIADGFTDDSVSGERFDMTVELGPDGAWSVTAAQVSWRCWPGRGHEDFSTARCH